MNENKHVQPEASAEDQLDQSLTQFPAEPEAEPATQEAEDLIQPQDAAPEAEPAAEQMAFPLPESGEPFSAAEMPNSETEAFVPLTEEAAMPGQDQEIEAFADNWIDEIMDVPMVTEEIGADENAVAAAGLIHPEEQELVDILEEIRQEAPAQEPQVVEASEPLPSAPETEAAISETEPVPESIPAKEPDEMPKKAPVQEVPEALPEEEEYRPTRSIRPRKKDAYGFFSLPHLAATVIWLAVIVFVGVGLGNILWEYAADMLAFGRPDNTVTITINEDDNLDMVSDKLQSTGLIKYPSLFKIYANLSDAMEGINPGTYTLSTLYDYNALVDAMSGDAARVTVSVVIPEGYNCQQIFQLLEKKGVSTVEALNAAASNVDPEKYWFLAGVENTGENWLEGYLFPDTYKFYLNHNPDEALAKLLTNFDKRYTDIMRSKLATLNAALSEMMRKNGLSEEYIAEHQMTLREVVIVASMIEKEAANPTEGYTIASVIYNRLTNPNAHPHLQIDATLVYVTGHSVLTAEDLALDNPYNTYKYPGLIPGPISNPSQASLAAALEPDDTNYHYYALNPATGVHKFSETFAEHEAFLDSLKENNEETP